ncbi:MAG: nucleoside-diphosphate kinase [candidate division Zixibacteria bacterium]|nr:nucleoside-diphosphate kinase [candidate division Zixibacteria bacterium]NIR67839.1 nucleoside-diphosphate kinase [candidate division Zixibacteria bacterium]NIS15535.1 nucleoside-diphosphate kinase [candidate division Zixibacteria bacterium]NIS49065.1 nucleoside-diphosphate kinase [candidate division Zixibacteria bacterium]NIT52060.1 nucleoside-diphosphate kinase [candidate division Zixibacteria bacterium]
MTIQRTLTIIKPDAVGKNAVGEIIHRFELAGFKIVAMRMERLKKDRAEGFYHVHSDKPFFDELVEFMTSGPCVPMVLEKENAIEDLRALIGVTDSKKAATGTIRQNFGTDIQCNAVHASDSVENARFEVNYFFPDIKV